MCRLSKLELWLKDNSITSETIGSKFAKDEDKSNIIFTLLQDSLSPLKCSFTKCFSSKSSEFNPLTLRFRTKENYCLRHRLSNNYFCNFLWLSTFVLACMRYFKSNKTLDANDDNTSVNKMKNRYFRSNTKVKVSFEDQGSIVDQLNTTCVACMAEDENLSEFSKSNEQLYNEQPIVMYKYHIGMCSIVFLALVIVLLITDLKK